jgi:hypothetical protein
MHRFKKDPEWEGARVRDGTLTVTDIEYINERVVKVDSTANNRDRDSINTGLFDDYCRRTGGNNALLILCDQLEAQDSSKAWHHLCRAEAALWQNCGEDDAKTGKMLGRMDPVLKCYPNCPQMITFNQDVLKGEAGSHFPATGCTQAT